MSTISDILSSPPNNVSTTLSANISSSALIVPVNDTTGLGTEGVGVIFQKDSDGNPVTSSIEFIHWTGKSGNNLTLTDTDDRGISGSASGAQAHSSGDTFEVWVHSAYYIDNAITGTAGTTDNLAKWNASGQLVDGPTPPTGTIVGTSDTQELSNKTHDGDFNLKNVTDNIQVNSADPWRTITLMPGLLKPTTTGGCAASTTNEASTNDIDYDTLDFDASSDESAFANFQMPESWDAGAIQFRAIWTNAGGGAAETVDWALEGRSFADGDAIDQANGTAVTVTDTWIAQGGVHISGWSGDVTLAGTPAAGELVHLEIFRDTSEDNLTGDARLIAVQVRYKQAKYGD